MERSRNAEGFGFPRRMRLTRKADFARAFREGTAARGSLFTVRAASNGLPFPRLGISVAKAAGGAVRRNRMKRLLREAFRLNRAALPPGIDLVVVIARRPGPGDLTLPRFAEELAGLAHEAAGRGR